MKDYEEQTIRLLRTTYGDKLGRYMDSEIAYAWRRFSDAFYCAGWVADVYADEFMSWATTPPLGWKGWNP